MPMGMVYVVMAHTKHIGADKKDVFFRKNEMFEVIPGPEEAWQVRIEHVRTALIRMYTDRLDETMVIE